jgi:hypothetical protein
MAAGLGFKTFATGDVLSAADVNGYLMQGVLVFASAAARDAAITSPQEGQFAYLKDTNVTTYYTGSAWSNLDTTGMTNPMTTTGDTIYSSSGSTPARLGIGSTGQVLTVAGGVPSWATPAGGGGKVLQVVMGTTSTLVTNATTSHVDSGLSLAITPSSATSKVLVLVSQNFGARREQEENGVDVRLVRTATTIMSNPQWLEYKTGLGNANISEFNNTGCLTYLDSPATTSATTYKTQFASLFSSNSGTAYANQGSSLATMILLEIGA